MKSYKEICAYFTKIGSEICEKSFKKTLKTGLQRLIIPVIDKEIFGAG